MGAVALVAHVAEMKPVWMGSAYVQPALQEHSNSKTDSLVGSVEPKASPPLAAMTAPGAPGL